MYAAHCASLKLLRFPRTDYRRRSEYDVGLHGRYGPRKRSWMRSLSHCARAVATVRVEVEVVSPAALRTQMAQTLRKTLQHYSRRAALPSNATDTRRS